jgi:uncharacterized protein YndB with AHSA1/START domain
MADYVATAEVDVDAPPERVWAALTDPREIEQYMFGSKVESDWTVGSPITWCGEYDGKPYEDHGTIVTVEPTQVLVITHSSAGSDAHTLTYRLAAAGEGTHLTLSQDHNGSEDERDRSQQNWEGVLAGLKKVVERSVL